MNHAPAQYINAGYSYELGRTPAQSLRTMLEAESLDDRTEARQLIETGRKEARNRPSHTLSDGKNRQKNKIGNDYHNPQPTCYISLPANTHERQTMNAYIANGFRDRKDYLESLCEEYPRTIVYTLASVLGASEDFDGLVTTLEDYAEEY